MGSRTRAVVTENHALRDRVTMVTVNFKTLKLTRRAIQTFRQHYPDLPMIVYDNGSDDLSTVYIAGLQNKDENCEAILDSKNRGHGPALHQLVRRVETPYVLLYDSDCEVLEGGFIELMLAEFDEDETLYAIGWLRHLNDNGVPFTWHVPPPKTKERFHPYVHPHCALLDVAKYKQLKGFIDHGSPGLFNMQDAVAKGFTLKKFPVKKYVKHWEAGTRRMFGGHWHPADSVRPKPWDPKQTYPI